MKEYDLREFIASVIEAQMPSLKPISDFTVDKILWDLDLPVKGKVVVKK